MENYGAYLTELEQIEVRTLPVPGTGTGEALIEVDYCGICGSDLHYYLEGKIGNLPKAPFPYILGHECAGTVLEVGENSKGIRVGDRVCIEPAVPCGQCHHCLSGRYNLCTHGYFISTPPANGAMQRYLTFPVRMMHKLPDNVSTLEGALMEPLAVGAFAVKKGAPQPTDTVVILGMGCIGMVTMLCCLERGVKHVIVSDLCQNRLDLARQLGATTTINAGSENVLERVAEITNGVGADLVFETAGSPYTAAQTSSLVCRGGRIVMVGNIIREVPYSFRNIYLKEATIYSVFRYCDCFPYAIDAVSRGRIDIRKIATDIFPYTQAAEAFRKAAHDKDHVIKAVVDLRPNSGED